MNKQANDPSRRSGRPLRSAVAPAMTSAPGTRDPSMSGTRSSSAAASRASHPTAAAAAAAVVAGATAPTPAAALRLNVLSVVFGDRVVTPWYPSLYREELVTGEPVERLFVCERCFRYSRELVLGLAHRRFCEYRDTVPGRVVYEKGRYSIYGLDGEEFSLFTQNLSLFSKLFIENKSVCFDVNTFLYYLLVDNESTFPPPPPAASPQAQASSPAAGRGKAAKSSKTKTAPAAPEAPTSPPHRPQIVGFFSKEKLSWDNNNLACILVFPPWQRLGLGQMLMGASYELARREGRLGGPERPLSTLGKKSYMGYWTRTVAAALLAAPNKSRLAVRAISERTYMMPEDVVLALQEGMGGAVLGAPYTSKADGEVCVRVDKARVRAWLARAGLPADAPPVVDAAGFVHDAGELHGGVGRGGSADGDAEVEDDEAGES